MRKKLIQLIFVFSLAAGGLFLPRTMFATCSTGVDIYIDGDTAPSCSGNAIFDEQNWVPGSKKEHTVEFRNVETDKDFPVYFEIENAKGNFAKRINLDIACNGGIYNYNKTLEDFYNDYVAGNAKIIFTLNRGETKTCTFQTAFNPLTDVLDNEYNCMPEKNMTAAEMEEQCSTSFDLNFGFEIIPTAASNSYGDGPEWFWQDMGLAGSGIVEGISKVATSILPARLPRVGAWSALVLAGVGVVWEIAIYLRKRK